MFVQFTKARYRKERDDMAFKVYVTDSLYLMGQRKFLNRRWYDQVRPKVYDDIDAAAVVADVTKRAGLVVV